MQAIFIALTTVATLLHSTTGDHGVTGNEIVNKHTANIELKCLQHRALMVLWKYTGAQTILWRVCQLYSLKTVIIAEKTKDRSEELFTIGRLIFSDILEYHRTKEEALA